MAVNELSYNVDIDTATGERVGGLGTTGDMDIEISLPLYADSAGGYVERSDSGVLMRATAGMVS